MIEYVFRYRMNDGELQEKRFRDLLIAVSEVSLSEEVVKDIILSYGVNTQQKK